MTQTMADNGGIHRAPTAKGLLIGSNDLSIAATALGHGTGVITPHVDEFSRVPDLMVLPY